MPERGFDLQAFHERGFACVEGALGTDVITAMRARLVSVLATRGVVLADRATWPTGAIGGLRALRRDDARPGDATRVSAALDTVFGSVPRTAPGHWGQALVAFPDPGPWRVPRSGWHCDYPFWFSPDEIWGAVVFLFLDDVGEHGGATLALEASPAFVRRHVAGRQDLATAKPTAVLADLLAQVPALRDATDDELRIGVAATDGSPLRVVELTGRAGDAVVCHPWLLHRASANATTRPRLQRAARVQRRFDR